MALELNGTTGVSLVQDGVVTAADLASTLDLTGKTVTLPSGVGGKVLQVVSYAKTDVFSTTSATFVDVTNLSISITPSSTSSKILILCAANGSGASNAYLSVFKNGTNMYPTNGSRTPAMMDLYHGGSWGGQSTNAIMMYLDSPSTTSAITYNVKARSNGGNFYINVSYDNSNDTTRAAMMSTLTAMEIAA